MSFVCANIIHEFEIPVKSFLALSFKNLLPYYEPSQFITMAIQDFALSAENHHEFLKNQERLLVKRPNVFTAEH